MVNTAQYYSTSGGETSWVAGNKIELESCRDC